MSPINTRGFALVSALWLLVLMSLIASALAWSNRQSIRGMASLTGGVEARYLAEGGLQLVYANLLQRSAADRLLGDGEILELEISGGLVRLKVSDENGKVDINLAQKPLLARLLYSLDVDRSQADAIADAIMDYRDEDDLRHLNGAEDSEYQAAGLGWEAKDAPFTSVEELRLVYGMEDVIFDALQPYVTIHSRQKGINPEVASLPVLLAVSSDSVFSLENYVRQRRRNHADSLPMPRAPAVDRRFLSRGRGVTYSVAAVGVTERGQQAGLTTTVRLRRGRGSDLIQTLEWLPYLQSEANVDELDNNYQLVEGDK